MSDLAKRLREVWEHYRTNENQDHSLLRQAADFIEKQQQRIAELEQREAELAVHVDRLHCEFDKGSGDPSILWEILENSPTTVLNAVRREVAKEAFLSGCSDLAPDEEMLKWAESYINEHYPDKEESNETK